MSFVAKKLDRVTHKKVETTQRLFYGQRFVKECSDGMKCYKTNMHKFYGTKYCRFQKSIRS